MLQDSLDKHYSIFFQLDNVPFEVMAYIPCLSQEFTVYADKEEAEIARSLIKALLAKIEYQPEEVGQPWEIPLIQISSSKPEP